MVQDVLGANARYAPIADYAVVGDCHTAALIARDGSIDWYCPKRFDAPAVFCRLLDARKGGYLRIAPAEPFSTQRRYQGPTNVLETTFSTATGRVRLTDFMAIFRRQSMRTGYDVGTSRRVLRLVEGLGGDVDLEVFFKPTFDYARAAADIEIVPSLGAIASAEPWYLALGCPGVTLQPDPEGGLRGRIRLHAGERLWVVLTDADDPAGAREALNPTNCEAQLHETREYWETWAATCTYRGPYRSAVLRSALALKLLTYEPTGVIVAAPTTSLPECIGGVRNWDYRFSWLRDSSLIIYALMTVGYHEEAQDFFRWLERTQHADPQAAPQIMYTIDGGRELPEITLSHLEGYRSSRPVRIGNGAARQFQLDIYGEVLAAAHLYLELYCKGAGEGRAGDDRGAFGSEQPAAQTWRLLSSFVQQAADRWQEPDDGIWETRGGAQRFLYSQLMCWVALDRGIRLAQGFGLPAPLTAWLSTRQAIRDAILTQGFNPAIGAFTQAFGSSALDASALAVARTGFLPATDPRVQSTVARIRADLTQNGLVSRYRATDGLPDGEAAFALCSFWLVDSLALGGRLDEAHDLFVHIVGCANDVGLFAEEIDPVTSELLGNFPQGFTHLALIRSAVNIAKAAKHGAEVYPETEAERASKAHRAASEGEAAPTPSL